MEVTRCTDTELRFLYQWRTADECKLTNIVKVPMRSARSGMGAAWHPASRASVKQYNTLAPRYAWRSHDRLQRISPAGPLFFLLSIISSLLPSVSCYPCDSSARRLHDCETPCETLFRSFTSCAGCLYLVIRCNRFSMCIKASRRLLATSNCFNAQTEAL